MAARRQRGEQDMDEKMMRLALAEAQKSGADVPVGAVLCRDGQVIAAAHNQREAGGGPFAHAEMLAMQQAFEKLGERRLRGCTLYVTLEPCPMCAGALVMAEVDECVFGAYDPRQGCCGSVYDLPQDPAFFHRVRCTGGILEQECARQLQLFFQNKRK